MKTFGCNLGLDTTFMKKFRLQTDDMEEFNLLTEYLDLDISPSNSLVAPAELSQVPVVNLLSEDTIDALKECCSLNV